MAQSLPDGVLTLLVGAGILVVGYLIKYRQWTGLISEATAVVPAVAETAPLIASLVGNVTLVFGGSVLVLGGLGMPGFASYLPEWLVLLLLVGPVVFVAPRLDLVLDAD